jgi:hypothetical protein
MMKSGLACQMALTCILEWVSLMRWLWHCCWSLSLVLAAGVFTLWVSCGWWTYQHYDRVGARQWLRSAIFVEDGFVMGCAWHPYQQASLIDPGQDEGFIRNAQGRWWKDPDLIAQPTFHFAGITLDLAPRRHGSIGLDWLYLPLLYPLLLLLIPPWIQAGRFVFYLTRDRRGRCVHCGYDLRGSPGACPECGHMPRLSPVPPEKT